MLNKKCVVCNIYAILKKCRHAELDSVSQEFSAKKGAMFGLDARIALAIFGALSVISGAALYSAIQESRVVSLITEMNELGKSVDAYQLDVGTLPMFGVVSSAYMDLRELVTSTQKGWKGPYISGEMVSTVNLKHKAFDYIGVRRMETAAWGNTTTIACSSDANPCGLYVVLANIPKELANSIDKKIDGTADMSNGKLRVFDNTATSGGDWAAFMYIRPYTYR